ncbi:hypothetical protein CLF_113063 [Clonorchis sinensis]|uniref:Uncharacterized protein n=1 Tax=Clonorchis sinensis TaxID=79923 RepID=G7YXJ5_CLOSI|nr:hypothetical protein CLF_113063 [Clonorchis sinensis]
MDGVYFPDDQNFPSGVELILSRPIHMMRQQQLSAPTFIKRDTLVTPVTTLLSILLAATGVLCTISQSEFEATDVTYSELNDAADKTLDLYSRVIDLQRRFYSHSCSSQQSPSFARHKPRSKTIGSPFTLCMGQKRRRLVRAYGRNDARDRSGTCEELRSELIHLVDDVFSNEQMEHNQPRKISIIRAPEIETHQGVKDSPNSNTHERSWSAESQASGSSIVTNGSFTRQSSRRSSGPRLVVDRRSQRRKQTAKIQQSEAYGKTV